VVIHPEPSSVPELTMKAGRGREIRRKRLWSSLAGHTISAFG